MIPHAESVHPHAYYILYTPPPEFPAGVGWMQTLDLDGKGSPSKVMVDWMRLHATVNGKDVIILEETFDYKTEAMKWYGLYNRIPWFAGDRLKDMPFTVENGALVIEPNTEPNYVFHWWNTSRTYFPAGTTRVWFESRIMITGNAVVQAGIDYWKDLIIGWDGYNKNNTEAGVSEWLGNSTADWQIITVGKP